MFYGGFPFPQASNLACRVLFNTWFNTVHNAIGIQSFKHSKKTNTISRLPERLYMIISIFFLKYSSILDFVMARSILCSKLFSNLSNERPKIPEWVDFTRS